MPDETNKELPIAAKPAASNISSDSNVIKASQDALELETNSASERSEASRDNSTKSDTTSNTTTVDAPLKTIDDPSKRVKADEVPDIDMSDFDALKKGIEKPVAKKSDEKAKEESKEKKVSDLAKEEPAAELSAKPAAESTPTAKESIDKNVQRDYTGFDESEQKVLRGMSNEAFAYIKPQLLEKKNLAKILGEKDKTIADLKVGKQMLPDSYFEHPQGFTLSKEWNEQSQILNVAQQVEAHWKRQFAAIRRGDDWVDCDIDPRTGALIYGKPQKADAEAEANVLGYMQHAANQINNIRGSINSIEQGFKARHSAAVNVIKEAEKKHFAAYEDEKHYMQPVIKNIWASIPPEFQSHPLASITVKAVAAVLQYGQMLKDEQAKNAKAGGGSNGNGSTVVAAATKQKAGPTEADTTVSTSSGTKGSEPEVTMDDFEKLKRSY